MANSGGDMGQVVKDNGGGSGIIDVPFKDKEEMVPIVSLRFFMGVVVISEELVELGEGFDITGLIS